MVSARIATGHRARKPGNGLEPPPLRGVAGEADRPGDVDRQGHQTPENYFELYKDAEFAK